MAKKNKQKLSQAEIEYQNRMESFQEHLPIMDIQRRLFVTKEGCYFPLFRVGEVTLDLMTDEELNLFANRVQIIMQSLNLDGCQFLTVPVPFDITPYKDNQEAQIQKLKKDILSIDTKLNAARRKKDELISSKTNSVMLISEEEIDKDISNMDEDIANLQREKVQKELFISYIYKQTAHIIQTLSTGLAAHKECFIVPTVHENWNESSVQEASENIEAKLKQLAIDSHRCSEQEMRNVLYAILNPLRKDIYQAPATQYTPSLIK